MSVIQTVCGKLPPCELGMTLMHEHLLWDDRPDEAALAPYKDDPNFAFLFEPVSLTNRSDMLYYAHLSQDNTVQTNPLVTSEELSLFAKAGGKAVVDVSSHGLYRDPTALRDIAENTGVHVIMATGLYSENHHPVRFRGMSADCMASLFIKELTLGVDGTDIRCGIIGEMGISSFGEGERTAMRAAGIAQRETGAAVTAHIDYYESGVEDALRILQETGCDLTKVILGHADRWWNKPDTLRRFLDRGVTVEYDTFGTDFVLWHSLCYPNDIARLTGLRSLIDSGYLGQLVLGHDIFCKMQLHRFGGGGYGHIPRHILPVMRNNGFSEEEIDAMLTANPARLLAMDKI